MNITRYIGEQFGKPTGIGGTLSTFIMNRMNQKQYRCTESLLKLGAGEQVLDIGFGNGYFLKRLSRQVRCHYYGIEISEDMVQAASARNRRAVERNDMTLICGDVARLPFEDNSFDKVYTINTVYFWSDVNQGIAEIRRVLKPGGVFINTVYSREFLESWSYTKYGFAKYTLRELEETAVANGFEVDTTTISKGTSYCLSLTKL